MSYTILYDKRFIRLSDNTIIPLFESGDNNVYGIDPYTNKEKRARTWESSSLGKDVMSLTLKDIRSFLEDKKEKALKYTKEGVTEKEILANFGYYTSVSLYGKSTRQTTYPNYCNFFFHGYHQAISFKDFCTTFGGLRIAYYDDELNYHLSDSITDETVLRTRWEEIKEGHSSVSFCPASVYLLRKYNKMITPVTRKSKNSIALEVSYTNPAGAIKSSYVGTMVPLKMVEDPNNAGLFKCDSGYLHLLSRLMRGDGCNVRVITFRYPNIVKKG